jgi:hypothetical protein
MFWLACSQARSAEIAPATEMLWPGSAPVANVSLNNPLGHIGVRQHANADQVAVQLAARK